jgi:hypothetical protein
VRITLTGAAVQKIINFLSPSGPSMPLVAQRPELRLRPTLRPWIGIIDQILQQETSVPRRFRTTAMQILKTLREEHGFAGGYTLVQEYVREARADAAQSPSRRSRKSHPPLCSQPRRAEHDGTSGGLSETFDTVAHPVPNFTPLRLSRRPRRATCSDELGFEWMQSIMQGKMSLDFLKSELNEFPERETKALFVAATQGRIPMRRRALSALAYLRGVGWSPICFCLGISRSSLFHYWKDFRSGGCPKLLSRRPRSDKKANNPAIQSAVFSLLHSPPSAHGFNRTTWRLADMRAVLGKEYNDAISCDVIREIIVSAGWKWRMAGRVLTSHDPEYRAKVDQIKATLSRLERNEAFFSIDEYGPFAVKKKGGRKRVAPGEQYLIPEWQKSKGYLILTAALELSTNQLTHFYSRKKNTEEMIKLADLLRSKYRGFKTIYLSWDTASWHVSKKLAEYIEKANAMADSDAVPLIKALPLPAGAQFLNVIESVFSGMARAIIHNSDYESVGAATAVIDRYIEDRNAHFGRHPQRAGKKIWRQERVPSYFAEEHNCKDPMYMFPQ